MPQPIAAQAFHLKGGTSTLYRADGGSVEFWGPNYRGWVGAGYQDEWRFGAYLETRIRKTTLSLGDDTVRFTLPTDLFTSGQYFFARGVGLRGGEGRLRWYAFGGVGTESFRVPYFQSARNDRGLGLLFLDWQATPRLRLTSQNMFSREQTSLHSLTWEARPWLQLGAAGGLGANQGYGAASVLLEKPWLRMRAAYVSAGDRFRRVVVHSPSVSEVDRENIEIFLRPKSFFGLTAARRNLLSPARAGHPAIHALVHQLGAHLLVARFRLGANFYESDSQDRRVRGRSFTAGRNIGGRLFAQGSYFQSRPEGRASTSSAVLSLREKLTPRLSLLQLVNRSGGRTSVSFGGNWTSNRLVLGINYQTIFNPFGTGSQFRQVLSLNFQLRLPGDSQLNVATVALPDGEVKYTAYGGTWMYGPATAPGPRHAPVSLHKYIARGRVIDEAGNPVRGAAVYVENEVAFAGSDGRFFVRKRKAGAYRLTVAPEEFLTPFEYELVSAPSQIRAEPEESTAEVVIIVRRRLGD